MVFIMLMCVCFVVYCAATDKASQWVESRGGSGLLVWTLFLGLWPPVFLLVGIHLHRALS
jgi:hypothetical protein